jgi:hypothetical protein
MSFGIGGGTIAGSTEGVGVVTIARALLSLRDAVAASITATPTRAFSAAAHPSYQRTSPGIRFTARAEVFVDVPVEELEEAGPDPGDW